MKLFNFDYEERPLVDKQFDETECLPKIRLKSEGLEISEKYREDGYILIAICKKVEGDNFYLPI